MGSVITREAARQNRLWLQKINNKYPVKYLDETYANAHDGKDKAWVEKDEITGGTTG